MKQFQHRLAISPTSLHTIVIIMTLAWIISGSTAQPPASIAGLWSLLPGGITGAGLLNRVLAMAAAALAVYILGELNISQILLRINSRAISFTFAALITISTFIHTFQPGMLVMLCLLMSYFTLFSSYQIEDSATLTYVSFLYLGISILLFPKMIWMAPVYWLSMYILRAVNVRSVCASILGLLTPLWVVVSISYCMGRIDMFVGIAAQMIHFTLGGYSQHTAAQTMTVWICFMVFLIGFLDCYSRINLDKTRTRTILMVVSLHGFVLYLFILLWPANLNTLLPAALIPTAIMGGHYVANDQTPLSNIIVWMATIIIFTCYILNTWIL